MSVMQGFPHGAEFTADTAIGRAIVRRNWLYGLQITVALVLFEGALWSAGASQRLWFWAGVAWILFTSTIPAHSRSELGLSLQGLRGAWWLLPFSIAGAGTAVGIAWYGGYLHPAFGPDADSSQYFAYALWALFQQFILQSYFFMRLERMLGSPRQAVVACALLFSLMHLPNPFLAIATFAAGLILCDLFRRHRNIYPLGLAHAVWGLCLAVTLSSDIHGDMRVGLSYLYPASPSALYSWEKDLALQQDEPRKAPETFTAP
jgi:membrane protease YdiL (CAAX protease family)